MTEHQRNRRMFDRFGLVAGYTTVEVRATVGTHASQSGHAYDISEGGIRLELDAALEAGDAVDVLVGLPGHAEQVSVAGHVAWVDEDEGHLSPRRMAVQFDAFGTPDDHRRLCAFLGRSMRHAA
jgi:Tfp pilus assembly protein PilZ